MLRPCPFFVGWLLVALGLPDLQSVEIVFNAPPGQHLGGGEIPTERRLSWDPSDRLVFTPYFYWYDVWSKAHLLNPDDSDALTTHPATMTGFSYKSVQWHRAQLLDMEAAGIDIVLPVYWGAPSELADYGISHWSYAGLIPLIQARSELVKEGHRPPLIGLFYDTTTLERNAWNEHVDLTDQRGMTWFYESVRDFYSLIPIEHRARIDGRPVLFTWASSWAKDYDQAHVVYANERFARDFGERGLYWVRESSWQLETESEYGWGGAFGLKTFEVATLGPGYDHSAVPDRYPIILDREAGAFFERQWIRFLRSGIHHLMIETWNEFHEGTDIAHSREYGRQYIELNRRYVDLFKAGWTPEKDKGPFSDSRSVSIRFDGSPMTDGLRWVDWEDGQVERVGDGREACWRLLPSEVGGTYLYLRVDDSFRWEGRQDLTVTVEVIRSKGSDFDIQFDGSDLEAPLAGAYSLARSAAPRQSIDEGEVFQVELKEARFLNSQNGGADFRIRRLHGDLCLRSVTLTKLDREDEEFINKPVLSLDSLSHSLGYVTVRATEGRRYVLESTLDLETWIPERSFRMASDEVEVAYSTKNRLGPRFFRIRGVVE